MPRRRDDVDGKDADADAGTGMAGSSCDLEKRNQGRAKSLFVERPSRAKDAD
jgi:hypothetical protein